MFDSSVFGNLDDDPVFDIRTSQPENHPELAVINDDDLDKMYRGVAA